MSTATISRSPRSSKPVEPPAVRIRVDRIEAHPDNPRDDWEHEEIESLAESVKATGLIQPVCVRPHPRGEPGRYQLVAGERRFRAAQQAGLAEVPAVVKLLSDGEALAVMLTENVQRRDFNPLQKARLLERVCLPAAEGGLGKTRAEVARMFGHEGCWASNLIGLLRLPPVWQHRISIGEVCETQARALVKYADKPEVLAAVENDYAVNAAWAWRTREDFQRNVELIAANPATAGDRRPATPKPVGNAAAVAVDRRASRALVETELDGNGGAKQASEALNVSGETDAPRYAVVTPTTAGTFADCMEAINRLTSVEDLQMIVSRAQQRIEVLNASTPKRPKTPPTKPAATKTAGSPARAG